ncbi:MAG TPA: DUF1080 domain-containing protein [Agriterribacter sp.]|nr:DUF1080 domain-containing protein [Agriterribacter sp.]
MVQKFKCLVIVCLLLVCESYAQDQPGFTEIPLNGLNSFSAPGSNWSVASDAIADLAKAGDLKSVNGTGVLINTVTQKSKSHLITKDSYGDLEIQLDFMMAKGSNSGIYLQGRYELQLMDSWTKTDPAFSDCGGIYQRWNNDKNTGFEGYPPLVNVARAPGLWQHLDIKFRAPRFNDKGIKTEDARFETVYLNGVLVQQQVALTGPTRSPLFEDERATGPLMIQGDHGNIAIRNIRYRPSSGNNSTPEKVEMPNPILINPGEKPYLLRSFLSFGDKLLTHTISVGDPAQINYSYDLKRGALLQMWRGKFADATDLWYSRGEPYQRIVPLGSVIALSDAPAFAVLADRSALWPDSIAFDAVQSKGYTLAPGRIPTYLYSINETDISDKISVAGNAGLIRSLTIARPPANFYHRIAASPKIERIKKGIYAVDDKSYYVIIDEKQQPFIRTSGDVQELLLPVDKANVSLTYSLTW